MIKLPDWYKKILVEIIKDHEALSRKIGYLKEKFDLDEDPLKHYHKIQANGVYDFLADKLNEEGKC